MATETPYSLGDYFDVLRRRWIWLVTLTPAAILIAVYLAFTLPPIYRSSATVMLEESSIPPDVIKTTVTAYADQQLELVRRRVMTTERLSALVEDLDPYPELVDVDTAGKAGQISADTEIERVDPITLEPLVQSNAFSLHYYNKNPATAKAVTERLVELFLANNRETRAQQATETYSFLRAQSEEAGKRIAELDRQLAELRERYGDALPEARGRNRDSIDRLQRELDVLQRQILIASERRSTLEVQLSQINPNLFDPAGDWRTELAALRAELGVAQQRYTPEHPEVRRLRRAIDAMSQRTDLEPSTAKPDNPEYIQVAAQLSTVKNELLALETSAARARQQIAGHERSLEMAPEVEREYSQLARDYEVAQERFRGIEASLAEAELGRALETEQRGERLTMIRRPNLPSEPDSPNRLGIILLGFVLGAGLSVGIAAVLESADPSVRSARDLSEITDIKPIGAVPVMLNSADKRRRLLAWGIASVIAVIAVVFVGSAVLQASA